jgi:hypothetical protein
VGWPQFLPIIRNGNSKFFGFNETETPETGRIGGRFPQILSAETPASNTVPLPRPCWRSKAPTSVRCGIPLKGQKIQTLINFHPGRRMSRVPCQNEGMKMILSLWKRLVQPPQTINQFGSARLVKYGSKYSLLGGTQDDQAAAREWASMFAPEIVF